jgi:predicted transposase/invertase (TIGR01784 family)
MEIARVVTIVITNFEMINSDNSYHHIFRLYDAEKRTLLTDAMEIHTLELKKLPETPGADEKEEELLDWLRLIRSEREEEIEMLATKTPEMKKAVGRLKHLSADEATRMRYEARELYLMDEMARRAKAHADGLAEGEAKGKFEVARNFLKMGLSVEQIAQGTGLSIEELSALSQ